ncbi:MAG TPA: hypothetical protein VLD36_11860 [Burkholderiales bacterium]|nr:hypothetical protein [Burkholderiales bacterium]
MDSFFRTSLKVILAVVAFGALAGCASDPRYKEGVSWVTWNEAEKARLQAAGFPQYNHD